MKSRGGNCLLLPQCSLATPMPIGLPQRHRRTKDRPTDGQLALAAQYRAPQASRGKNQYDIRSYSRLFSRLKGQQFRIAC